MSHLCWSTTLLTFAIITVISCYRAVCVSLNEPLRVLGSSSVKEWWLVNARDWPYKNCSTDSSLTSLCWADFISVSAWMAFTGTFPFNTEKKEETMLLFPDYYKSEVSLTFSELYCPVQPRTPKLWYSSLPPHAFILHLEMCWVQAESDLMYSHILVLFSSSSASYWSFFSSHLRLQQTSLWFWMTKVILKMCHLHILKCLFFQMCWKQPTPSSNLL